MINGWKLRMQRAMAGRSSFLMTATKLPLHKKV